MDLYSEIFHSTEIAKQFSSKNAIGKMLLVESALAKAQAANGIFSKKQAETIAKCCKTELINIEKIKTDIKLGGNAAIPLVKQLTEIVKKRDAEAAKFVHLGATSQDIVDTAIVLQIQEFLGWLDSKFSVLETLLFDLTKKHRSTVMAGRTLLQQAKPITFGLKTAGWLESINRSKSRISETKKRVLVVQLSGAVGSGNVNISKAIQKSFAKILSKNQLPNYPINQSPISWHAHRDNLAEFAAAIGILTGSLGKIARDVSILMQTEIGEVLEGAAAGKGVSSTMPHKRNPVSCAAILANAHRMPFLVATILAAMPQENERSAGLWHAEWPVLEEIMQLAAGTIERGIELLENLEINEKRMLKNLELTDGLIFAENVSLALALKIGKAVAHELVEKACKTAVLEQKHLKNVLLEMKIDLPENELAELFKPENAIGLSLEIVDDILKKYENQL